MDKVGLKKWPSSVTRDNLLRLKFWWPFLLVVDFTSIILSFFPKIRMTFLVIVIFSCLFYLIILHLCSSPLPRAATELTSPYIHVLALRPHHKSYCTLSNSYCTLCVPKHTILGPGNNKWRWWVVDDSSLQPVSQCKSVGFVCVWSVTWHCSACIRWTGWTLVMIMSRWQHHKHCPGY